MNTDPFCTHQSTLDSCTTPDKLDVQIVARKGMHISLIGLNNSTLATPLLTFLTFKLKKFMINISRNNSSMMK